jgi:hypothetical protein
MFNHCPHLMARLVVDFPHLLPENYIKCISGFGDDWTEQVVCAALYSNHIAVPAFNMNDCDGGWMFCWRPHTHHMCATHVIELVMMTLHCVKRICPGFPKDVQVFLLMLVTARAWWEIPCVNCPVPQEVVKFSLHHNWN